MVETLKVPAAKWQAIAEYVWLLQKVQADKTFIVFGQDADVAERFLRRVRPLTAPVEFYFLDETGHRILREIRSPEFRAAKLPVSQSGECNADARR